MNLPSASTWEQASPLSQATGWLTKPPYGSPYLASGAAPPSSAFARALSPVAVSRFRPPQPATHTTTATHANTASTVSLRLICTLPSSSFDRHRSFEGEIRGEG